MPILWRSVCEKVRSFSLNLPYADLGFCFFSPTATFSRGTSTNAMQVKSLCLALAHAVKALLPLHAQRPRSRLVTSASKLACPAMGVIHVVSCFSSLRLSYHIPFALLLSSILFSLYLSPFFSPSHLSEFPASKLHFSILFVKTSFSLCITCAYILFYLASLSPVISELRTSCDTFSRANVTHFYLCSFIFILLPSQPPPLPTPVLVLRLIITQDVPRLPRCAAHTHTFSR